MSFSKGFEKTAAFGPAIGQAAGYVGKKGKQALTAVKSFATGQRVGRVEQFRKELANKPPIGFRQGAKHLAENPTSTVQEAKKVQKAHAAKVLARKDRMTESKVKSNMSFAQKHPYLTAGGTLLAAKTLLGGNDNQAPPPPPQVVQY